MIFRLIWPNYKDMGVQKGFEIIGLFYASDIYCSDIEILVGQIFKNLILVYVVNIGSIIRVKANNFDSGTWIRNTTSSNNYLGSHMHYSIGSCRQIWE